MNTKTLTIAGCLLLLAVAVAPTVVVGHSERAALPGSLSGYPGPDPVGTSEVSGRYVGGAGPAVAQNAYVNPQGTLVGAALMLCDAEVIDGTAPSPSNENLVDGALGGGIGNFWDDGGIGGACHTHHYTHALFNTLNCYAGVQAKAKSHAGTEVWIGASCDWKTDQGGALTVVTLALCIINNVVLALNPFALIDPTQFPLGPFTGPTCINAALGCLLNPTCGAGGTQICGPDSTSDAINYGYGSGAGVPPAPAIFPANTGIVNPAPGITGPCPDGPASVFVFDTVATNAGSPLPQVYPALTGEIWA